MTIKDTTANPAPLGLLGFGMTTVLLNLHNAGLFPVDTMILAMGIFYGGLAQIIAGIMEWKKGNTFGTTAFLSYGLFWQSLVGLWLFKGFNTFPTPNDISMGFYLFMWGLFTLFMFFATRKSPTAMRVVFCSLFILFFLLALKDFTGVKEIGIISGIEGIFCGLSAFYYALAQVINESLGKTALPIARRIK